MGQTSDAHLHKTSRSQERVGRADSERLTASRPVKRVSGAEHEGARGSTHSLVELLQQSGFTVDSPVPQVWKSISATSGTDKVSHVPEEVPAVAKGDHRVDLEDSPIEFRISPGTDIRRDVHRARKS